MSASLDVACLSSEQRGLWDRACQLWEQSRGRDPVLIGAALHPQYVGWDMSADAPHDREAAIASVTGDAPELMNYSLVPHSVQVYEHAVGVVHYSYQATVQSHGTAPRGVTGKWTEVYLRQNDEWMMVAVSGRADPSPQGVSPGDDAAAKPLVAPDGPPPASPSDAGGVQSIARRRDGGILATASPFIWHELVTSDQPTSGAFFRRLFNWTSREVDAGPFGTYTLFQRDGQDVAGMMNPTPDSPGKGSYWHSYIAVDDIDAITARVSSLGGRVLVAPHDVPEFGRVGVIADPTGAVAHLVQPFGR